MNQLFEIGTLHNVGSGTPGEIVFLEMAVSAMYNDGQIPPYAHELL